MPIFDYLCHDCKETSEVIVSFKDLNNTMKCPNCGSRDTERLLSASGQSFRLYGSGFEKRTHKDTGDWGN